MRQDAHPSHRTAADSETSSRRRWSTHGLVVLVVLLTLALAVTPPIRMRVVAFATVADGLGLSVPRPFAAEVTRQATEADGIEVDRYGTEAASGVPAGGQVIVLVPGAAPAGRDDDRIVSIAEALARSDRTVIVPELEVYAETLVPSDIDRIGRVAMTMAEDHGPVVLAGVSFGGSLSLIAAADPSVAQSVALVATFGAYADLGGVVQAATTGISVVDGERFPWDADPRAAQVVQDQLLGLLDDEQRAPVASALDDGTLDTSELDDLPDELQAVARLLGNDDPERTDDLLADVPRVVQDRIRAVSPARAAPDVDVPIVAMHAIDDPVIPYGEFVRLQRVYPHVEPISLTSFDHVGLAGQDGPGWWATVQDLWGVTEFRAPDIVG